VGGRPRRKYRPGDTGFVRDLGLNEDEEQLPAGRTTSGIVRRGDRIWRPVGPWSPAVHEYLRHLETAGFAGAPRVVGTDGDREILTFLPGEVAADPHWHPGHRHRLPAYAETDEALTGAGRLIRRLHDAAAGFVPVLTGYRFRPHPPLPDEIICHGDLGPWNTVYRDGGPTGFIDWDGAGPAKPLTDLAAAAWVFVPIVEGDPEAEMARRLALFVTSYGLADPAAILSELVTCRLTALEDIRYLAPDAAGAADLLELTARQLRFIHRLMPVLATALGRL
jgi:hypothetical protein